MKTSLPNPLVRRIVGLLLTATLNLPMAWAQAPATAAGSSSPADSLAAQERAIDKQHLTQIYQAIQAYKKDHGELPNWLSDLFPDYLKDPDILLSPVEKRTGQSKVYGYADPKMKSSYIYEFCGAPSGTTMNEVRLTMKQWKTRQLEAFGPVVPILRCHLHDPLLNIAFSGDYYETVLYWETDPNTLALVKRLGTGQPGTDWKYLSLKVVDANDKPLPDTWIVTENLRSGIGPHPPRTITSDANGLAQVPLGIGEIQALTLVVTKEGFANAKMSWESGTVPSERTVKLTQATTVGGDVRDPSGKPIGNARVQISGLTRDDVGQVVPVEYETVQTDASGRWTSSHIPKGADALSFKLTHTEFMPTDYDQADTAQGAGNVVAKADLTAGKAAMVMEPGIVIEGTVADDAAKPAKAAEVVLASGDNLSTKQRTRTDSEGRFRFVVFEATDFHLLVQSKGCAPEYRLVTAERGLKPLAIVLSKGKVFRARITDSEDKAVAGAIVSVNSWNNQPWSLWNSQCDGEGRVRWDSAPGDSFTLSVSKAGYNSTSVPTSAGSEDEAIFKLEKTFQLSGKVLDAETKEPIKSFKLMTGRVWGASDSDPVSWERGNETSGANGVYTVSQNDRRGGRVKYMALAEGYLPASSPDFEEQGWHTHDFLLKKGSGPKGVVQSSDGQPVVGAEVAIVGVGYLNLGKAAFANRGQDAFIVKSDAQGRFSLPAVVASPTLIAVHEQGYCETSEEDLAKNPTMKLQPWGSIEGTLMIGSKPGTNVAVMVAPSQSGPNSVNYDWENFKADTDEQGHFRFTQVPPGERRLVRLVPMGQQASQGWAWSHIQPITVKPGETLRVTFGGQGRPIVGKMVCSDPSRKIDWQSGHHSINTRMPRPPGPFSSQAAVRAWERSPEYKEAMAKHRYYAVQMQEDGTFRADDIPAGSYQVSFMFQEGGQPGGRTSAR